MKTLETAVLLTTLSVVFCSFAIPSAVARTWNVLEDGTGDAPFIQAAVDSAADCDTVLVWPGTYLEEPLARVWIFAKSLTLVSKSGSEATTIRGSVYATGGGNDGIEVNLVGFTIVSNGGEPIGVWQIKSILIEDFTVRGYRHVSVVHAWEDVEIRGCVFRDNVRELSLDPGGALHVSVRSRGEIENCRFIDNSDLEGTAGALHADASAAAELMISNCIFSGNRGRLAGAIRFTGGRLVMRGNTLVDNRSDDYGAAYLDLTSCEITGNVFAWNYPFGIFMDSQGPGPKKCWCNAFWKNEGWIDMNSRDGIQWWAWECGGYEPGSLDYESVLSDPQFCDRSGGDFTLRDSSPLLPENFPGDVEHCGGVIGAFEVGCTGPPPAIERSSWGRIKAGRP
jgi:hypothetical protein